VQTSSAGVHIQILGPWPWKLVNTALVIYPALLGALLLVVTIADRVFVPLLGIPLAIIGHVLRYPMNPSRAALSVVVVLGSLVGVGAIASHAPTTAWLVGSAVTAFWANRLMYGGNVWALRQSSQTSDGRIPKTFREGGYRGDRPADRPPLSHTEQPCAQRRSCEAIRRAGQRQLLAMRDSASSYVTSARPKSELPVVWSNAYDASLGLTPSETWGSIGEGG
jgi:hypothetical protein